MVDKCLLRCGVILAIDVFSCSLTQTSCAADFNSIWRYNGIRSRLCWRNEKSLMNRL